MRKYVYLTNQAKMPKMSPFIVQTVNTYGIHLN